MQSFYTQFENAFGQFSKVNHALFYDFPNGIRFGLSDLGEAYDNGSNTEKFYRALNRSIEIYKFIFKDEKVYINIRFYLQNKNKPTKNAFQGLNDCGFSLDKKDFEYFLSQTDDTDDDVFQHQYTFETHGYNKNVHALLWLVSAKELVIISPPQRSGKKRLGERPQYPEIHFVNLDKRIIFHPYDDRGADLVAIDIEEIRPVYSKFYNWILDYDLKSITEKFGKPDIT